MGKLDQWYSEMVWSSAREVGASGLLPNWDTICGKSLYFHFLFFSFKNIKSGSNNTSAYLVGLN